MTGIGGAGGYRHLVRHQNQFPSSEHRYLYMKEAKKKTVTLTCTECGKDFERRKCEVEYQRRKNPGNENWYCSLSCLRTNKNKSMPENKGSFKYRPQRRNNYGQVYPEGFSWYVSRCAKDRRFGLMEHSVRHIFADALVRQWEKQRGRCAYAGLPLVRRLPSTPCTEKNPFLIASVDRIDCSKGYEPGNVQWVSHAMNQARSNVSDEDFREFLKVLRF